MQGENKQGNQEKEIVTDRPRAQNPSIGKRVISIDRGALWMCSESELS